MKDLYRSAQRVHDHEQYHGASDRDEDAIEIEPVHTGSTERGHDPAADNRTNYADDDVEEYPLAVTVDDLARDEARDESDNDPRDDGHVFYPFPQALTVAAPIPLRRIDGVDPRQPVPRNDYTSA